MLWQPVDPFQISAMKREGIGKVMRPCGFCGRALLLSTALFCSFGQSTGTPVEFEVAAVHESAPFVGVPGSPSMADTPVLGVTASRLELKNYRLFQWIAYAYDVPEFQIASREVILRERYDLSAKLPQGSKKQDAPRMLQSLLAERFGLRIHREARKMSGYALVVQKGGAHLVPSLAVDLGSAAEPATELSTPKPGWVEFFYKNCTMSRFTRSLSKNMREPIVDATNLAGAYDIPFGFSVQDLLPRPNPIDAAGGGLGQGLGPAIGTSMVDSLERLGLKLESRSVTVEMIVVDSISRPTAN